MRHYKKRKEMYSKEYLKQVILDLKSNLGRSPSLNDLKIIKRKYRQPNKIPSSKVFFDTFGSWKNALESVGLTSRQFKLSSKYTREELLKLLEDYIINNGKVPVEDNGKISARKGFPSRNIYKKFFGAYSIALSKTKFFKEKCNIDNCNVKCILDIHHKDGNRKNNKLENIELLCPNHHGVWHRYKRRDLCLEKDLL